MKEDRSLEISAGSGALGAGATSAVVFNGATLNLQNMGKKRIRLTGFTVFGNLQSGANIFVPVDQLLSVTITSAGDSINSKDIWDGNAVSAGLFSGTIFSGVFEKSCTFIKFRSPELNSSSVMSVASRAINLVGVAAGDTVNTYIIIHYEFV